MEDKINIAELLKYCPKGMELDCTVWENVTFEKVRDDNIFIRRNNKQPQHDSIVILNEYGCVTNHKDEKCRIFPKGKITWEGFQRPFQDGDIIATDLGSIFILKSCLEDKIHYHSYFGVTCCNEIQEKQIPFAYKDVCHLATEEEKQKLFQAIKDSGYRWNTETKTLEKLIEPKFKVGDRIKAKSEYKKYITNGYVSTITSIKNGRYWAGIRAIEYINEQDDWELAPNKFDITTLKPFDKVLVRDFDNETWEINFFSRLLDGKHFKCLDLTYVQCIPYEGNEHLLNTTNKCDEFFKVWEKQNNNS